MAHDSIPGRPAAARALLAAILWSLLVAVLLLSPGSRLPQAAFDGLDKLVHALLFAVECALLARLPPRRGLPVSVLTAAVLLSGSYAALLEIAQLAVSGRAWSWWDLFAGWAGVALAAAFVGRRRARLDASA